MVVYSEFEVYSFGGVRILVNILPQHMGYFMPIMVALCAKMPVAFKRTLTVHMQSVWLTIKLDLASFNQVRISCQVNCSIQV